MKVAMNDSLEGKKKFVSNQGEKSRLLEDKDGTVNSLPIWDLFRFASKKDKCLMWAATILAVGGGTVVPFLLMALGDLHTELTKLGLESNDPFICNPIINYSSPEKSLLPTPIPGIGTIPDRPFVSFNVSPGVTAQMDFKIPQEPKKNNSTDIRNHTVIPEQSNGTNASFRQFNRPQALKVQDSTVISHDIVITAQNNGSNAPFRVRKIKFYTPEALNKIKDELLSRASKICIRMAILALLQWLTLYGTTAMAGIAAARQGFRMRAVLLRSLLHQDIAWFDAQQKENFAVRIIQSLDCVQQGIGEKVTLSILYSVNTLAVLITGFAYSWKVSLVILSSVPLVFVAVYITSRIQMKFTSKEMAAYSNAGSVAEEALSGIKTVFAYGAEGREMNRYRSALEVVRKLGSRMALLLGIGTGIVFFFGFSGFGLGLWYGSHLVVDERCQPGAMETSHMLAVILCVLNAAVSLSQAARNIEAFSAARAAAVKIFDIIDRVPIINSDSTKGVIPTEPVDEIRFKDVCFRYPLREDTPILRGFSFTARAGETIAFIGASGCGKSTVMNLLQRFYDPVKGEIYFDDTKLRNLNIGWLRSQFGVVGQEPVLFEASIAENIGLGGHNASHEEIIQASFIAGAHDFIMKMPQQYNTLVGEKGAQLSGGQKQRIAIARAIVRDPKILILDEATSALDSVSESKVQAALDHARKGRITLVIAHRMSTTRNADRIVVMRDGMAEETGNHSQLISKRGLYYQIVSSQISEPKESSNNLDLIPDFTDETTFSSDTENELYIRRKSVKHSFKEEIFKYKLRGVRSFFRFISFCSSEWHLLLLGVLGSIVVGATLPLFAYAFALCTDSLSLQKAQASKRINELALFLVGVGLSAAIGSFIQNISFGLAGERQSMRTRKKMFAAMLSQEVAWYDDSRNASGALCAQLTTDAANVRLATVERLRSVFQALSTLALCILLEVQASSSLALVASAFIPVVFISTYLNKSLYGGNNLTEKLAEDKASKTAVEAIRSIRTVVSLHKQDTFIHKFIECMHKPFKAMPRTCHLNGFTYGLSQSAMPFACVAVIYYGTTLMLDGHMNFTHLFRCVQAVIISMVILAETLATSPDYSKSWQAAGRIIELLDSEIIGKRNSKGRYTAALKGNIVFRNVHFSYPLRPEVNILRGLDLKVKAGQTVALVGTSGCGKSTCVGLLQRFYDCKNGDMLIDGVDIREYDVNWLRSQMGLVSQEPSLFGVSVAENIAYGEGRNKLSAQKLMDAAKTANIHKFICTLPEGYHTKVGGSESWLSAGEKQRVAIARALVRDPTILLLDEATSALDTESELVVQEALDKARQGRTCIVIAHRLSTIQNADLIAVIHEGLVVEKGKHSELLSKEGFYYKMYTMQQAIH